MAWRGGAIGLIPAKVVGIMANTMIREVSEESTAFDSARMLQSERGVAAYRCKIYKTLLDITSESDYTKRPLVDRSGRWMATPPRT
jgi:altronate dehydratase